MRNRRDRRHGNSTVVHITNRTAHGLPFVCSDLIEALIVGIMGRAQSFYPVVLCHYLWMGNHYHMILAGRPRLISHFMGYVDGEVAKSIKRLVPGMYTGNVWQDRFKEQRLATAASVIETISYLYNNPARAGLVNSIEEYPGISSYGAFHKDDLSLLTRYYRPGLLTPLRKQRPLEYLRNLRSRCSAAQSYHIHTLTISPYAWRRAFQDTYSESPSVLKRRILERTKLDRARHTAARHGTVIGAASLREAPMHRPYFSRNKTRTPFLICDDKELRNSLIRDYKGFCKQCCAAWHALRTGFSSALSLPYGTYASAPVMRTCLINYS